jgi:hypothetical protein
MKGTRRFDMARQVKHVDSLFMQRKNKRGHVVGIAHVGAFLALLILGGGCAQQRGQQQPESTAADSSGSPRRELAADERRGGHTLSRHVGKSDDELQNRLSAEPRISAASTYSDRETAEIAVGEAIRANQARVEEWEHRSGGHPNLVLDYDGPRPLGRSLRRNAKLSQPCLHAVVVLKWESHDDFIVLTSYPECR